jgi:general L-amino acid transport system substrate-binding protein
MSRRNFLRTAGAGALGAASAVMVGSSVASAHSSGSWNTSPTLDRIRDYGMLRALYPMYPLPPFHSNAPNGHKGYDCDFVRALAAAIFNSSDAESLIEWDLMPQYNFPEGVDHDFDDRYNLLSKDITDDLGRLVKKIDVSVVLNTHKFQRDAYLPPDQTNQPQWGPIFVHDGAGAAYNKTALAALGYPDGFNSKDDIPKTGTPVVFGCAVGTSNEAIVDAIIAEGFAVIKQTFTGTEGYAPLAAGTIPVIVDDFSSMTPYLNDNVVRGAQLDINPLGWCVAEGDSKFHDILNWVTWGLFAATEFGVTSKNVTKKLKDPTLPGAMKILFGLTPVRDGHYMWEMRDCDRYCFQRVIKEVGNWGEIWDRHMLNVLGPRAGPNSTSGRMFFPVFG